MPVSRPDLVSARATGTPAGDGTEAKQARAEVVLKNRFGGFNAAPVLRSVTRDA